MPSQKYNLNGGLHALRKFITQLSKKSQLLQPPVLSMMMTEEQAAAIASDHDELDRVLSMLSPDEGQPRAMSRATVNTLVSEAIEASLKENNSVSVDERIGASIALLETKLKAQPSDWEVWRTVDRLKVPAEGFTLGKVFFCSAEHEAAKKTRERMVTWLESKFNPLLPQTVLHFWPERYSAQTLCRIATKAVDATAARELADGELQTTMAVLNFFASLVFDTSFLPVVCIPGNVSTYTISELATPKEPEPAFFSAHSAHRYTAPFDLSTLNSDPRVGAAFAKAGSLLRDEGQRDFRDRLLTAIKWAGKGAASQTEEDAYLFYAIALESLLIGGKKHDQIAYKLRLRAAHLIGINPKGRASVRDHVKDLYDLRSAMVHSGKTRIPKTDLVLLRFLTQSCIIHILGTDRFEKITTDEAIEQWFEDLLMAD
jgi:hypothetical protein